MIRHQKISNYLLSYLSGDFIKIIPDDSLELLEKRPNPQYPLGNPNLPWTFYKLIINDLPYTDVIKIAPWRSEHYVNFQLLKLKLYCEQHKIKIVAHGYINHLPILSIIADELYLQCKGSNNNTQDDTGSNIAGSTDLIFAYYTAACKVHHTRLELAKPSRYEKEATGSMKRIRQYFCRICNKLHDCELVKFYSSHNATTIFTRDPNTETATRHYGALSLSNNPYFDQSPGRYLPKIERDQDPTLNDATKEISDEEVIQRFALPTIKILKSSFDLYCRLRKYLPKNCIICETNYCEFAEEAKGLLLPLIGSYTDFQSNLIREVGQHYMSIQLLGSIFSNWFYLCEAGSSTIHGLLGTKTLTIWDFIYLDYYNLIRGIFKQRYGEIGQEIPLVSCDGGGTSNPPQKADMLKVRYAREKFVETVEKNTKNFNKFITTCTLPDNNLEDSLKAK